MSKYQHFLSAVLSHENKKVLVHFVKKNNLIENECKTTYGYLTLIFYQNMFYYKME